LGRGQKGQSKQNLENQIERIENIVLELGDMKYVKKNYYV